MVLGSFWAIKVLKIPLIKKNVKHSQTERVKKGYEQINFTAKKFKK